jgi:hypothetical protein
MIEFPQKQDLFFPVMLTWGSRDGGLPWLSEAPNITCPLDVHIIQLVTIVDLPAAFQKACRENTKASRTRAEPSLGFGVCAGHRPHVERAPFDGKDLLGDILMPGANPPAHRLGAHPVLPRLGR